MEVPRAVLMVPVLAFAVAVSGIWMNETTAQHLSGGRWAKPPANCPITQRAAKPFVPPSPYPKDDQADPYVNTRFWFGTEKLWTQLPTDGTWRLGHYRPADPRFRQKLFWWRQGYDFRSENPPKLIVSGTRIDAPAPPLETDEHANNAAEGMVTGLFIPTAGCWRITGDYKGDTLNFVVWVAPE